MSIVKCNGKLRLSSLVPLFIMFVGPMSLVLSSPLRNSKDNIPQILSSFQSVDNKISDHELVFQDAQIWSQQNLFNKRRKRELTRSTRKISSSPAQMQMPAYYPFIMAEMMPGAVKTRHPSIIAVNGCPAYFIADHRGRCRQVFQYTVNFGQRHTSSPLPTNSLATNPFLAGARSRSQSQSSFIGGLSRFRNFFQTTPPTTTTTTAVPSTTTSQAPKPKYSHKPPRKTSSPGLLALFRNAAKKLDFPSFLTKKISSSSSSSNSGETNEETEIKKLRGKILKALKITRAKEQRTKRPSSNSPISLETTTVDYDD